MKKALLLTTFLITYSLYSFAASYTVFVSNNKFEPQNLPAINQGDSVEWFFEAPGHTTTSGVGCVANGEWDSGIMDSGTSYIHVFDSAGSFTYFCTPHCQAGMVGQVTVRKNTGIGETPSQYLTGSFTSFPNPFAEATTIQYELKNNARVNIQIIDIAGRVVEELNPMSTTGINKISVSTGTLPEGIYVARLLADGIVVENKLLIKQR